MKRVREKGKKRKVTTREGRTPSPGYPRQMHLFAVALLVLLSLIYFSPYLFDQGRMIFGTDWIPTGGYARMFWQKSNFLSTGNYPCWMPHLFSGFSIVTAYGDTFFYPLNLLTSVLPTNLQRVILFSLHASIGGIGIFYLLRLMKCGVWPSLFAGVAYEFSGVILTTTYAGHLGRMIAAALLPVSFYFLFRALRGRSLGGFLLFGGFLGLHLLGGHFQMSYIGLVSMALFILYYLFARAEGGWDQRFKLALYFCLAIIMASGVAAVKYIPPYSGLAQGARGVERGYEYATSWSLPIAETVDLLVPNFSGILDNYWGLNYFKLSNEFTGVLPLLLAIIAVVWLWRRGWVRFFAAYVVIFLLFSYGGNTPFYEVPYHVLPLLTKFRAPAMLFFISSFGMIVLAGIGLQGILEGEGDERNLYKIIGVLTVAIFVASILFTLFGGGISGWIAGLVGDPIQKAYGAAERTRRVGLLYHNLPGVQSRLWIAFLISLSLFLGIYLFRSGKITAWQFVCGLIFVTLLDQWNVDRKYLKPAPSHEQYFAEDDVVRYLRTDSERFRVFPVQYRHDKDGLLLLNGIDTIGGYGANPPRRYQRFIGAGESVMFNPVNLFRYRGLLDILNVKYIIVPRLPGDLSHLSQVERGRVTAFLRYLEGYRKVFSGSYDIYLNPGVLPRAFVAHRFEVADGEEDALKRVLDPGFDHRHAVVLERDPGIHCTDCPDTLSGVKVVESEPQHLTCSVNLKVPGILVISENYHPDWKVFVDGSRRNLLHVDYVLKGVALTAGPHKVEFVYRSSALRIGEILTFISFGMMVLLVYGWRKRKF
jgi:hypothetical protein